MEDINYDDFSIRLVEPSKSLFLSWYRVLCEDCEWDHTMEFAASLKGTQSIVDTIALMPHFHNLVSDVSKFCLILIRLFQFWGSRILGLRFVCGFPLLLGLVVCIWRKRNLLVDETIEQFLQGQNNLVPIKYTYSEIKKMTNNFNQRIRDRGTYVKLRYGKMFQIALGVAHGIDYQHCGCDMPILHFDIKPLNFLLDENFIPKISNFGFWACSALPTDDIVVNLDTTRGTMGYMAPAMFYKSIGGISYKADVYIYGMLLIEMVDKKMVKKDYHSMRPFDRPSMNKVAEMLEGDFELEMPPKPFMAPREIAEDHGIQ
ncbi:hypothetical protein ACJIZ3_022683 [Penstemon smallii]|uniref:Protein kinase domain-containing protein n=1 Tax=Penstemon smallii TaxID=265156 RepID=A0ABD3TMU1_9LAMI